MAKESDTGRDPRYSVKIYLVIQRTSAVPGYRILEARLNRVAADRIAAAIPDAAVVKLTAFRDPPDPTRQVP
jgi:hypothetical protein